MVRPTGLVDPIIIVRPASTQVDDLLSEISSRAASSERVLVTTLTKRMAEDLTDYLAEHGVKVRYLHSDIDTVERVEIIRDLRLGEFNVLVGINLLREGLDIPEVSLVAILDADKEGFLRSGRSLIQTIGRAARHINGTAIMYADRVTDSMQHAIDETDRRRAKQEAFNVAGRHRAQGCEQAHQGHYRRRVRPGECATRARAAQSEATYQLMGEAELARRDPQSRKRDARARAQPRVRAGRGGTRPAPPAEGAGVRCKSWRVACAAACCCCGACAQASSTFGREAMSDRGPAFSILFVCMGNICRSPTAEGVFRHHVAVAGLSDVIAIASAGTHDYHIGEPPDRRSQAAARQRRYDLSAQRARHVVSGDFECFDYLLAMDRDNLAHLERLAPPKMRSKARLFLEFGTQGVLEVPDPYYGGPDGFERVLDLVEDASRGLLAHLQRSMSGSTKTP